MLLSLVSSIALAKIGVMQRQRHGGSYEKRGSLIHLILQSMTSVPNIPNGLGETGRLLQQQDYVSLCNRFVRLTRKAIEQAQLHPAKLIHGQATEPVCLNRQLSQRKLRPSLPCSTGRSSSDMSKSTQLPSYQSLLLAYGGTTSRMINWPKQLLPVQPVQSVMPLHFWRTRVAEFKSIESSKPRTLTERIGDLLSRRREAKAAKRHERFIYLRNRLRWLTRRLIDTPSGHVLGVQPSDLGLLRILGRRVGLSKTKLKCRDFALLTFAIRLRIDDLYEGKTPLWLQNLWVIPART